MELVYFAANVIAVLILVRLALSAIAHFIRKARK